MKKNILVMALSCIAICAACETRDSIAARHEGFSMGILPSLAYDSDLGLQYGALTNLYWYGKDYPNYEHSLYLEVNNSTKGGLFGRAYYDSRKFIPQCRTTIDLTYFDEEQCDFTGFNGRETRYAAEYTDEKSDLYRNKQFYSHKRRMTRVLFNLRKSIGDRGIFCQIGTTIFNMKIGSTGHDGDNIYDRYVKWGLLSRKEADGGTDGYIRAGIGYDTRDDEAFPTRGMWSEILLGIEPQIMSKENNSYGRLTIYHRQYFDLNRGRTVLAYRIGVQNRLWGRVPFYLLPHWNTGVMNTYASQGLGGGETLRGIVRNRIVGDGSAFCNLELRQLIHDFEIMRQDFTIGANIFTDMGMITQKHKIDLSQVDSAEKDAFFTNKREKLHQTVGGGVKISMNHNFIVSFDIGHALDKNDGTTSMYVQMNYMF